MTTTIKKITLQEFEALHQDFRGEWSRGVWEFRGRDFPESWIGKKNMLHYDPALGTCLLTEGVTLEITKD